MRALLLSVAFAAALGGDAMAQAGNTAGLVDLPGMKPTETSPVRRLAKPARVWIEQERERQLAKPGDLVELAFEIETNIGPAIVKIAERERIDTRDIIMAIMFEIMQANSDTLKSEVRRLQAVRDRGALSPADDAALAEKVARKAEIDGKLAEIAKNQSMVSRALVANN